jgi:hypothetical protein
MSNVQSYNALIDRFHAFASGHFILKRFSHGQIEVSDLEKFGEYPFMHVVPSNVTYAKGMKTFSFQIVLADMPRDKEDKPEYQREVLSDLQRIAEDLVAEITNHRMLFGDLITVNNVSLEPFLEEFQHTLTGWTISLDLLVPYYWDACSIPAEWNDFFESGSGGTGSILTFIDSINRDNNGNVSLVNDEANPSPNYYYGTNDEGVRGWYLLEDGGLTCETIGDCQTIIDIEAAIDALEEEILLKADITSISAVGFSNNYNDLDNLPTIPTATSDLTNDGADGVNPFITSADVPAQVNADWNATSGVAEILNKPTLTNGTVTSVGLTMPSAFSVANSPITSSGSLDVTGAGTVSQYVRGDGSLANFPASTGGGGSLSYYLNGSVAQGTFGGIAMKEMDRTPVLGAGTDFTIATNGYIQSFITDANVPNQLEIPAGNWTFETYFSASNNGGNPSYYIELYKWNGATLSLIASSSANPERITNGTSTHLYISALAVPQTALALTDRLAVRIYVNNSGRTITLHTENSNLLQVITTFSTGLTALNGLTAQVQNFATGTAGTDFGISSDTSTHTFNLPTASAVNRGALSSADWTTFNNKQAALVSGTNIKTVNGTTLLGSGNVATGFGGFSYTSFFTGASPSTPAAGQAFVYSSDGDFYQMRISYTTQDGISGMDYYFINNKIGGNAIIIQNSLGQTAIFTQIDYVVDSGTYCTISISQIYIGANPFTFNNTLCKWTFTQNPTLSTINGSSLYFGGNIAVQPTLVSGTNIKTINGNSVLGAGNLVVSASPSGVAGAIQFSNGSAFSSDAANLFWDDTNNRLGIGTATPTTPLEVIGRVTLGKDAAVTTQSVSIIQAKDANTGIVLKTNGTGSILANIPDGTATGGNARGTNSVDLQMTRAAATQVAAGPFSFIGGGANNQIVADVNSTYNIIGGGRANTLTFGNYNTISGGELNTAGNASVRNHSTVVGGRSNFASGTGSVVGGEQNNVGNGATDSVAFGRLITITGQFSAGLGYNYSMSNEYSFGLTANARSTASNTTLLGIGGHAYLPSQLVHGTNFLDPVYEGSYQSSESLPTATATLTTGQTTPIRYAGSVLIIPTGTNRIWNVEINTTAVVTAITGTATGVSVGNVYIETKKFAFKKVAGVSSVVGVVDTVYIKSDGGMTTAAVTAAAGASQSLALTFVAPTFAGGGSVSIRVISKIDLVEIAY